MQIKDIVLQGGELTTPCGIEIRREGNSVWIGDMLEVGLDGSSTTHREPDSLDEVVTCEVYSRRIEECLRAIESGEWTNFNKYTL